MRISKSGIFKFFFLLLTIFLVEKVFSSKIVFLMQITYILLLFLFFTFIMSSVKQRKFSRTDLFKNIFIFNVLSATFILLLYSPKFQILLGTQKSNNGTILFIIYLFFIYIFKPQKELNIYAGIISLFLIPVCQLAKFTYTAQVFASLALMIFLLVILQLSKELYARKEV